MSRRTQVHTVLPWKGGLNLAVDSGVISDSDVIQADNVVFATSGARIKREGRDYFDTSLPTLLAKSSSGTTRTLIFDGAVSTTLDDILVVGEKISVSGDANYSGNFTVASIGNFTVSPTAFVDGDVNTGADTINETSHGYYTGVVGNLSTTGTLPAGLSTSTDYYIIEVDSDNYKLATSLEDASAGTAVDITAASGGGTHTFTPTGLTSNNSITYTAGSSLSEAVNFTSAVTITKNHSYIGVFDFWYYLSNAKQQEIIAVSDEPKIYKFTTAGERKELTKNSGATALASPTKVNFLVAENTLIMTFDIIGNTPKKYQPVTSTTEWYDLGGSPPDAEVMQYHLGRVFANNKTNLDRLHYSPTNDIETWDGTNDSGAIDIHPEDGDPEGIISLAKPFRGRFFVSKKNKIVDLRGDAPENFRPVVITEGLGMVSHGAIIPVDVNDLMFVSDKGFHSMVATDTQGDFDSAFLSIKIQPAFNSFESEAIDKISGAYYPDLNSVAFTVTDSGSTTNNNMYLYNIIEQEWYRWPDVYAQSVAIYQKNNRDKKLLLGTNAGRLVETENGSYTDYGSAGPALTVKTGTIYPGNDPQSLKLFKKLSLYFKPTGDFTFTVKYQIDNYTENSLTFTQPETTDLLGSSFILGSSTLGNNAKLAPITQSIDGIGRGITLTIESSGTEQPIEIYGYAIEWEYADINQEVING